MKRARVTEEQAYGTALDRLTGADKPAQIETKGETSERPPATAMIKLSVFLNREEDSYLETLASTAKFSGGKKLSKTRLIEAMVRAYSTTELDVRGVKTDEELFHRVIAQLRR
ncbi:hypothetical protein ACFLUU_00605 [Chloroflexota bacterium]